MSTTHSHEPIDRRGRFRDREGFAAARYGGPHGGPRGRGRRHGTRGGRAQRGDVRAAVLFLLDESPMHGYQLMQEIANRTDGSWRPSPGAVYPTISLLEDEGYVEVTREGSRQLVTLTDAGRAYLNENRESFGDPFAARTQEGLPAMADAFKGLVGAAKQVMQTGSADQVAAATKLMAETRRSLYLILADDPGATQASEEAGPQD